MQYFLCFLVFLLFSIYGKIYHTNQKQTPLVLKYYKTSINTENDSTQILQQIINLPQLQAYYHSDLPQRTPLVIEKNKYVSAQASLKKFNHAVVFLSKNKIVAKGKKAYLTIQSLDMNAEKQQATVIFAYAIEGVGGQVILNKVKGKWKVVKSSLYEN